MERPWHVHTDRGPFTQMLTLVGAGRLCALLCGQPGLEPTPILEVVNRAGRATSRYYFSPFPLAGGRNLMSHYAGLTIAGGKQKLSRMGKTAGRH